MNGMTAPSPIAEILVNFLITPGSDFYLSTMLYSPSGNSLDPHHCCSVRRP